METVEVKFISFADLRPLKGVPYTRRHLRDLVRDGKFPQPVTLSEGRVAWIEEEVNAWQEAKVKARQPRGVAPADDAPPVPAGVAPDNAQSQAKAPERLVSQARVTKRHPVVRRRRRPLR
jgi:prophage regulatory protein